MRYWADEPPSAFVQRDRATIEKVHEIYALSEAGHVGAIRSDPWNRAPRDL